MIETTQGTRSEAQSGKPHYNYALGYLRGFLVLLVVAHHAMLAYHPFAPPPQHPSHLSEGPRRLAMRIWRLPLLCRLSPLPQLLPLVPEELRGSSPNAASAAGNQRDLSLEFVHVVPRCRALGS